MKKRYETLFSLSTLDEYIEQLAIKQATRNAPPEQQLIQDLHHLHAARAEHERQLLERVQLRLRTSGSKDQNILEGKEEIPEPISFSESNSILLPLEKDKRRLGPFFQSLAAVLFVSLLVGSFLALWNTPRLITRTASGSVKHWQTVPSPHLSARENHLFGVSAITTNDAWAVGTSIDGSHIKTLIEHWDGQQWDVVVSPNPGVNTILLGVAALAPDDVWAVGDLTTASNKAASTVLIEHWNGEQWSGVQAPTPGSGTSFLSKIVAISATNVWAVGSTSRAGGNKTLIEHWDGNVWSVVSSPSPASTSTFLRGITAISANDIWAVGYTMPTPFSHRAFLEHWDGKIWSIVNIPTLKTIESQLFGVSAISPNDVWAVGTSSNASANAPLRPQPLIEHWDGKQWSPSLLPPGLGENFWGVQALASHDVWAVGATNGTDGGSPGFFAHWDGKQWNAVQAASAGSQCQNNLDDIASIPHSGSLWSVGDSVVSSCGGSSPPIQPLFEIYTL